MSNKIKSSLKNGLFNPKEKDKEASNEKSSFVNNYANNNPNILFLFSNTSPTFCEKIPNVISSLNANPVSLDYEPRDEYNSPISNINNPNLIIQDNIELNKIIKERFPKQSIENIKNNNSKEYQEMCNQATQETDKKLVDLLKNFIKTNKISGIFLPGDIYNYDAEPYHPEPKSRPRYVKALLQIAKDMKLPLLGICGGLQGVMHAEGVEIKRLSEMVGNKHTHAISHNQSENNISADIVKIAKLDKGTNVFNILKKMYNSNPFLDNLQDWEDLYIEAAEAHGGAINHSPDNIKKLEQAGYRIVARSVADGVIQGVEHNKYDILLMQNHIEASVQFKNEKNTSIIKCSLIDKAKEYHINNYVNKDKAR